MALDDRQQNELILPAGVYAHILDNTKGNVQTYSGPIKQSLSGSDVPVTYDTKTKRFVPTKSQADAIQNNVLAPKGYYVILENPARNTKQPECGRTAEILASADALLYGEVVNIAGPWSHPLWPQQVATVVKGHQLRSNQYLLARVYDDDAAKKNWKDTIVKGADGEETKNVLGINPDTLTTGQILVIKGTSVSFYIPPSGIEVMQEEGKYVQDAVTLERLEFSILLDESGNKSYVQGPAVVFPTPTQIFYAKGGKRKFRAFELQVNNGILVKVVKDYTEAGESYTTGQELFITGKNNPIYFPREEHAAISYGEDGELEKTYAIAVPEGDSRYLLNRETGNVELQRGPTMLLPDPRTKVIIQRRLTDGECALWYPGNQEALRINRKRRGEDDLSDSDGGFESANVAYQSLRAAPAAASYLTSRSAFVQESAGSGTFADAMSRKVNYTPPRTVQLENKYEGAPKIMIWPGHAIQIVNSKGERRTEVGPKPVLLEWDETLQPMSLSKGKPKNPDNRMSTVFLRYDSNGVSDILDLVTNDLVNCTVAVKYLVRFEEAAKDKWFALDNYVQFLCDHLRSMIGNAVRQVNIQEFHQNAATIIRDIVLGLKTDLGSRPFKHFEENGMCVYEVELVAPVKIIDASVSKLLTDSRQQIMADQIAADLVATKLVLTQAQETSRRAIAEELAETAELNDSLNLQAEDRKAKLVVAKVNVDLATERTRLEASIASERTRLEATIAAEQTKLNSQLASEKTRTDAQVSLEAVKVQSQLATDAARIESQTALALVKETNRAETAKIAQAADTLFLESEKAKDEHAEELAIAKFSREIDRMKTDATSSAERLKAITPGFVEALVSVAQIGVLEKVMPQIAALGFVNGQDTEVVLTTLLKGTGAEGVIANLKNLRRTASLA